MNITYLIFVHNNPILVQYLVERLKSPFVDFMIHVDKKSTDDFSKLFSIPNVHFAKKQFSVEWGGISMVEALLSVCSELIEICKGETVIFLSGADYPVKSNNYILNYLEKYKGFSFIQGNNLPTSTYNWQEGGRRRTECYAIRLQSRCIATIEPRKLTRNNLKQLSKVILKNPLLCMRALNIFFNYPKRRHPDYLRPYGGEFWWILPTLSLQVILSFVSNHPDFLQYHRDTSSPDELFFQTLAYNLFSKKSLVSTCLRYINWKGNPSPENIKMEDEDILQRCIDNADILFVRKVSDLCVCKFIDIQIANKI